MKTVIIYKSKYGSTETYAKWLAKDLKADLLKADQVKAADLQKYDIIVYGGGIYAGRVRGITLLTKNFESIKDKAIYLFTVGASDVIDSENSKAIRNGLEQNLPPAMWERLHVYHLRGGMHYSKMKFMDRVLMGMMIKMLRKKPENELSSDDKDMLANVGKDADFTDYKAILPLVTDIKAGAKL